MKIMLAAPSFKRPDMLETPAYIPEITVVVCQGQEEEYRKRNPDVTFSICPDAVQGNISRVRNWILDTFLDQYDCVVTVDDDLQGLYIFEEKEPLLLKGEMLWAWLEKYTRMAKELGVKLWGVNVNTDQQCYREMCPFSFVAYIGSPFQGIMKGCPLRYDERLSLKEDYDMSLQQLNRYRKTLRVNKAYYATRQIEQTGGVAEYRNLAEEKRQMALLKKKWGSKIVRTSDRTHITKTRTKDPGYHLNPILSIPIKGT